MSLLNLGVSGIMEHAQRKVRAWVKLCNVSITDGWLCVCIMRKKCANGNKNVPTEPTRGHVCLTAVTMTSNRNN